MAYRRPRQPTTILWKPAISEWGKILGTLSNQLDLQTALDAKVPYTGATADLDLGAHNLQIDSSYMIILDGAEQSSLIYMNMSDMKFNVPATGLYAFQTGITPYGRLDFTGLTTSDKTFTFPDASGTLALREVPIANKTGAYTVVAGDYIITGDATTGAFTITLPTAVGIAGREYIIKKVDSSANAITVDANASETIDGALTQVISDQYTSITIVSNGSNWYII